MDKKERFYATINLEKIDRHCTWLGLPVPSAVPGLLKYFQVPSLNELKIKVDDDIWPIAVPYNNPPHYDIGCALNFAKVKEGDRQDERTLTAPGFFKDYNDPNDVEKFKWPNPSKLIDKDESLRRVKAIPKEWISMGFMWSAHFQDACSAFGMEDALISAMMNPDLFNAVVDRIIKFHLDANEIFYEATKGYLDAVTIGNDFGSQFGLMVSPEFLKEFIFPGTKKLIDQAKSYGLSVMHHSCGSVYPVIGDIFDMGADLVHPMQALAKNMEPQLLKKTYGSKGAFCGGVDAQELLVHGSVDEVKDKVAELKEIFPTGLVIAASHEAILPDINPENINALFN